MTIFRKGPGFYQLNYVPDHFNTNKLLDNDEAGTITEFWENLQYGPETFTTYGSDVNGTLIGDNIPIGSVLEAYVERKNDRHAMEKRLLEFLQKQHDELKKRNERESKEDRRMREKLEKKLNPEKKKKVQPILPGIVSSFLYFGNFVSF